MIYWTGAENKSIFFVQLTYAENLGFKIKKGDSGISNYMAKAGGRVFVIRHVEEGDGTLSFYNAYYRARGSEKRFVKTEKIYTDEDSVDDMPDDVVIRTDDLDKIRLLFFLGKRVSWYEPDINNARYFAQFDFKDLFLNLFNFWGVVYPTGETFPLKDEFGNVKFIYDNGRQKKYIPVKWARKIGYVPKALSYRVDLERLYKINHFKIIHGIPGGVQKPRIRGAFMLAYFNMLAITYMLWKQSTVASVKTKSAFKG